MPTIVVLTCILSGIPSQGSGDNKPSYPFYDFDIARKHEIKPHRRTIPLDGVSPGFNQLRLELIVSPTGDVIDAHTEGEEILKFWLQLQREIRLWKFEPFTKHGKAVMAEVEEYVDLVPPGRMPEHHVTPPIIRPDSSVRITLQRTGCYGSCPAYTVSVATDGIVFDGRAFVGVKGTRTDTADASDVRRLAEKFVVADFYSFDDAYIASVTDNPEYILSIEIDGHKKTVEDYVGSWVGMPAVVTELENEVDSFARTKRWIGSRKY
jgi:Domain of unknown function (DUF6438)